MENVWPVLLDALLDSLKVLGLVFVFEFLLSFFEGKIARALEKSHRFAPALGALVGIVPQCGVSVVAEDLYEKKHLTLGTLVAVFLACSDEALPILFGKWDSAWYMVFILIGCKILIGASVGILVDLAYAKGKAAVKEHHHHCPGEEEIHFGCCGHEIEGKKESPVREHLLHPVVHSLKIFAYVLAFNVLFGLLVLWVGQDNLTAFLNANRYLTPLFSALVGLIPNCVSSVLLANLYLSGSLPFGALLAGLLVNAGLGMLMLFKRKENLKGALSVLAICFLTALLFGYVALLAVPVGF